MYTRALFYTLGAFLKKWASIKNHIAIRNKWLAKTNTATQRALNRKWETEN